jgi:hypothetical protein
MDWLKCQHRVDQVILIGSAGQISPLASCRAAGRLQMDRLCGYRRLGRRNRECTAILKVGDLGGHAFPCHCRLASTHGPLPVELTH